MPKSQPILNLKDSAAAPVPKTTPNLLPCLIHHDGSIGTPNPAFWDPKPSSSTSGETEQQTESYFRGRKLLGKTLPLPEGYRGVVATPSSPPETDEEVIDLEAEKNGTLQIQAEFDQVVVWAHENLSTVNNSDDAYVRAVEEWVGVAGAVHSFDEGGK
ncbi:ribonuclease H2, subunit C [Podospora australis]|uniref:Ribonuclease H2, subunit C n=1 Tax=Podospora australis TaxID=1536484 RepID=A0AAN6WR49_9PEZI|nr:ribonuclease H2, subunit C [Podospora australis]